MSERLNNDLMDIEEIVNFGKQNSCCPFYGSRQALPTVDVCVLPYNLLLVPSAREVQCVSKCLLRFWDESQTFNVTLKKNFSKNIFVRHAVWT